MGLTVALAAEHAIAATTKFIFCQTKTFRFDFYHYPLQIKKSELPCTITRKSTAGLSKMLTIFLEFVQQTP